MESETSKLLEYFTLGIALWGAVLATIVFGWNLFRDLSDRGKLRVSCYMGLTIVPGVGIEKENQLIWSVTNVGRQPVLLTHIGGRFKKRKTSFMAKTGGDLPRMLQPGEYYLHHMGNFENLDPDNIKSLEARDSLDRAYKAPRKQVKEVKQALRELMDKS